MAGLIVKKTNERGLGVFATQPFNKGDLIECCRVIVISRYEVSLGVTAVMRNYVVDWNGKLAVPTGYGCFYNHSYKPNAIHNKHLDLNEMHFYALKDILPDEEITFNYGGYPDYSDELWFEVKNS